VKIVRATPDDQAALVRLMTASALLRRYGVTAAGARASLREALRGGDALFVAVERGDIVGLAWLITTRALDRSAYLRLLLVADDAQSQGAGAALLARTERAARLARCRHLALLVTRSNRRARDFYERHGYAYVGDMPGFVRPRTTEALYVKSMSRA
jgi:GNAT superfamily N-acetyltransferase